jgi:hypothetical protein
LDSDRADKYRQHAAECLEAAQTVTDHRIRENLVGIAQSFQRLAQEIERRSDPVESSQPTEPDPGLD